MIHYGVPEEMFTRYGPATVLDIGASVGDFARIARDKGCEVVCVEPYPPNVYKLREQGFRVLPVIAHSHDGVAAMGVPEGAEETGCYATEYIAGTPNRHPWPCLSLRSIVDAVGEVDVMKVDIEGGEYRLLNEASDDVLAGVDFVTVEFHAWTLPGEDFRAGVGGRKYGHSYRMGSSRALFMRLAAAYPHVVWDGEHDVGGTITAWR